MKNTNHHSQKSALRLDMDSVIRDILRQWWVILIVSVSAALLAGTYKTLTYTPEYTASTTFAVGKSGFSSNLASDNLRSAETVTTKFTQIACSSVLKKRVCEELGLSSFSADVSIQTVPKSNLMTMRVTADSPQMAYRIIHQVMDDTVDLAAELMDQMAIKVLLDPSIPTAPRQALYTKDLMKQAGLAAAAFMILLFALLSYMKDTVKNPEDASAKLDTRLLGSICHERKNKTLSDRLHKKKFALTINNPTVSFSYAESIQMAATRVRSAMDQHKARLLLITSVSENEGKSTIAANLALAMSREGKRVILIDCDFRKPSQYKIFDIPKDELDKDSLLEQLQGKSKFRFYRINKDERLWLLCNTKPYHDLLDYENCIRLRTMMDSLLSKADYILIDTSPMALVSDGEALAELAQASLLVVQQDMMEAKYINDVLDRLNATNAPVLGCILNNVRTGLFSKRSGYGTYYSHNYRYTEHSSTAGSKTQ